MKKQWMWKCFERFMGKGTLTVLAPLPEELNTMRATTTYYVVRIVGFFFFYLFTPIRAYEYKWMRKYIERDMRKDTLTFLWPIKGKSGERANWWSGSVD